MKPRKKKTKTFNYNDKLPMFCIDKNVFNENEYVLNLRYWDSFLIGYTTSFYIKHTIHTEIIYKELNKLLPKNTLNDIVQKYHGEIIDYPKWSSFTFKSKSDIRKCKKELNFIIQSTSLFI